MTAGEGPDEEVLAVAEHAERIALGLLGDPDDAREVAQTAIAGLLRKRRSDEPVTDPRAYVAAATRYLCHRVWTYRGRHVPTDPVRLPDPAVPHDLADRLVEDLELAERAERALAAMTPRQREVVTARYIDDLPQKDVAELLDVGEETVKSLAAEGRKRARRALDERGNGR